MINHLKIGKMGEDIACEYLINRHWKVLGRNYRRKSDEIDIIARSKDKTLVFVEVKSLRRAEALLSAAFTPEDNLSSAKLHKISRTCEFFARKYSWLIDADRGWRIDLIAIDLNYDGSPIDLRHYENI